MRHSTDEYRNGQLWAGFAYDLQVWVKDGRVLPCGHPVAMGAVCCNGRRYAGLTLADAHTAELIRGAVQQLAATPAAVVVMVSEDTDYCEFGAAEWLNGNRDDEAALCGQGIERIADQVAEHLPHPVGVQCHLWQVALGLHFQPHLALGGQLL